MTVLENQTMNLVSRAAKRIADLDITLRDIFAMSALNGIIANGFASGDCGAFPDKFDAEQYAESAYCIADAMLEARKSNKESN